MSTKAKRHVHKYHHIDTGMGRVWACALPDCNHYMPKHMESMVVGKNSMCWSCEKNIVLNTENMKNDKPKCANCTLGIAEDADFDAVVDAIVNLKD